MAREISVSAPTIINPSALSQQHGELGLIKVGPTLQ